METIFEWANVTVAYFDAIPGSTLLFVLLMASVCGYFLDDALGETAHGIFVNSALLQLGGVAGVLLLGFAGVDLRRELLSVIAAFSMGGAIVFMIFTVVRSKLV